MLIQKSDGGIQVTTMPSNGRKYKGRIHSRLPQRGDIIFGRVKHFKEVIM